MMLEARSSLANYLRRLQSEGRLTFTREQAQEALAIKGPAFLKSAARLLKEHLLLNPRHGFYVAVPPQYLTWQAPPPNWYIDDLMRHEGCPYYVGLLKAAEQHGASHHAVMEFQIITNKQLPKIRAGRSLIAFYFRKDIESVAFATESRKTDTGSMKISSVELTAFDLIRYLHVIGGIDAAGTVLADLAERIDAGKLTALAPHFERVVVQRLGYILEKVGHQSPLDALHAYLFAKKPVPWAHLEPQPRNKKHPPKDLFERDARWHIIVNRNLEIDR